MPTTYAVSDLLNQTLQVLGSVLGQQGGDMAALYNSGGGGAVTNYDYLGGLVVFMNAAIRRVCEDCWPLKADYTIDGGWTAGQAYYALNEFTLTTDSDDTSVLWWPETVNVTQVLIPGNDPVVTQPTFCDEAFLRQYDPSYQVNEGSAGSVGPPIVAADPLLYWYPMGSSGLGIYKVPYDDDGTTVTVDGLYFPPPIVDTGTHAYGSITYLDGQSSQLVVYRTAMNTIMKAINDQRLAARTDDLEALIEPVERALVGRLPSTYLAPNGPYAHMVRPTK